MPPTTVYDWYVATLAAQCRVDQRCRQVRGALYASEDACMRQLENEEVNAQNEGGLQARVEATYELPADTGALAACVAGLDTVDCATRGALPSCRQHLVRRLPANAVMPGEACTAQTGEAGYCVPGTWCSVTAGREDEASCGTCVATLPEGAPCDRGDACDSGRCVTGACAPVVVGTPPAYALPGEACGAAPLPPLCAFGAFTPVPCPQATPRTCVPSVGVGAACGPSAGRCELPSVCVAGTCVDRLPDGAACNENEGIPCAGICSSAGTCVPLLPLPSAGEACSAAGCDVASVVRRDSPEWCTCEPRAAEGEPCELVGSYQGNVAATCNAGLVCVRPPRGVFGVCRVPLPVGAACESPGDCESGACSPLPGGSMPVCVAQACAPDTDCTGVNNHSPETALEVVPGVATRVSICPSSGEWQYLRIAGSHVHGAAFHVGTYAPAGIHNRYGQVEHGRAVLEYRVNGQWNSTETVVSGTPDDGAVFISVSGAGFVSRPHELVVLVRPLPPQTCPYNATNTTDGPPATVLLDIPVQAAFCSLPTQTGFHWEVPGPFAVDDLVMVDVTYAHSAVGLRATSLLFSGLGGGRWLVRRQQQAVQLDQAAPTLLLVADGNPSWGASERFTFTVSRDTENVFRCADPPTNLSLDSALLLEPGVDTAARACAAARYRALHFKTGPLAMGTSWNVDVTPVGFGGVNGASVHVLGILADGSRTTVAGCTVGSPCTAGPLETAVSALLVRIPVESAGTWAQDFTVRVAAP